MRVLQSEFVISAVKPSQYPEGELPEFALAGRSNVGKSSLINNLINRKRLARTSSTPGKTQTINFYLINDAFYFADVPGYGFARVPKSIQQSWGKLMRDYLTKRTSLRAVIIVLDLRHKPSSEDRQMYQFCRDYAIPTILVATKADKISRGQRQRFKEVIRKELDVAVGDPLIIFSAEDSIGSAELWREIDSRI